MTAPTLPGMPLLAADLRVCHTVDVDGDPGAAPAAAPIRAVPTGAVWLILNRCRACNPRTGRYCTAHDSSRKFR